MAVDESGGSALGAYMNTPVVAMDMKRIVEALSRSETDSPSRCAKAQLSTIESFDKIQYWGFPYGTLLGETFAAMYPDLVDRMVLDGVVDADRHYAGTWDGNLEDADAIMKKFADYCFEAGLERCALYSEKGPQGIQDDLDNIIASIADAPISVPISDVRGPAVITHSDVKGAVRDALYSPFESFEKLGRILLGISQGNGTLLADSKMNEYLSQGLTPKCRLHGPYSRYCFSPPADYAEEVVGAIACSDGPDQTNMTAADFIEYWWRVRRESRYLGDRWARNRLMCVFWRLRPRVTYPHPVEGLTSKPILFVSNTLDPVTSLAKYVTYQVSASRFSLILSSGQKMSRRFNGSRRLQQDSVGYFQTGVLPDVGTICSVYERPFGLSGNESSVTMEPGDSVLLDSLRAIASHMW
ncbi:Peptidase S33 tripeptidyl aminopeptidase-like C-terminal protein [Rutstroemia sp. NJR-2017a BBW]|nr:Peptidase S33 tripeptidyl aminopeptidase-like C-terminal protein [Rutstroemia sp. NJR-2017a BBW]